MCNCKTGYAGTYCRQCSKGFSGWPNCVKCLHGGTWDEKSQKCSCPHNFKGDVCEECAFGYSGDECTANAAIPVLSLLLIVIVAALAVGGVLLYNRFKKSKRPGDYELVSTLDVDGEDLASKSSGVVNSKMEKLDFGDEIEGDDAIGGDVVSMGLDPEKVDSDPLSAASTATTTTTTTTQTKSQPVIDLLGDVPVEDDDDESFFTFNSH